MKYFTKIGVLVALTIAGGLCGCAQQPKPYGSERQLALANNRSMVWAIAPTLNLSGQPQVDPLLQSDLVFEQMQQVHGLTVIPVDRVVEVYASLHIDKVESAQQAELVCKLLGCDALVVPTVTAFDPYDPPILGASLAVFMRSGNGHDQEMVNPRDLARGVMPAPIAAGALPSEHLQAVGMFDASAGSIRDRVKKYAEGRSDPSGPYGVDEILVSMDRYCGFGYHELIVKLMDDLSARDAKDAQASVN